MPRCTSKVWPELASRRRYLPCRRAATKRAPMRARAIPRGRWAAGEGGACSRRPWSPLRRTARARASAAPSRPRVAQAWLPARRARRSAPRTPRRRGSRLVAGNRSRHGECMGDRVRARHRGERILERLPAHLERRVDHLRETRGIAHRDPAVLVGHELEHRRVDLGRGKNPPARTRQTSRTCPAICSITESAP